MSKINDIQNRILQLEGGRYQKLLDEYLYRKYKYNNWTSLGSQIGTDKTTKGIPDAYVRNDEGKYIFLMYGTVKTKPFNKIMEDIKSCLDKEKTGVSESDIDEIICCHTSSRLTPGENQKLFCLFPNLRLIGIGELSQELCCRYPGLIREYLGLSIDTDQILDDIDFIRKSEENVFATSLSNRLLHREREKSEIQEYLKVTDVVIISGKSGIGKTRLALEVCRDFCNINGYTFKCIKQNGESIYEDLKTYFTDGMDYVVFVDDANMMVQLSHLLNIYMDKSRVHKMKIILTVRDYAVDEVLRQIKGKVQAQQYELQELAENSIWSILKEEFGILNSDYLEQILRVTSGNMRLAIMATVGLKKGVLTRLNNVIDIYNCYYQDMIEKMSRELIVVGALVAFFDSFKLNNVNHLIYEITSKCDIKEMQLKDICFKLHTLEVIDLNERQNVKFSEQGLANYLLYIFFYEWKYFSLSDIIKLCFFKYRQRISYTCNTLLQLFYSDELQKYVFSEIRKVWMEFNHKSRNIKKDYLDTFHIALNTELLSFIKQEIDQLPENHKDFLFYNFESMSNHNSILSDRIRMIAYFKRTNDFNTAIELLFLHITKNTAEPKDFYLLIKVLSYDKFSHLTNYQYEKQLLIQFWEYYLDSQSSDIAVLLIYLCQWLLKFEFEFESYNVFRERTFNIQLIGLLDCETVRDIRDNCIDILFYLYNDQTGKYKRRVRNVLKTYFVLDNFKTSLPIAKKDFIKFHQCINFSFKMDDINDCLIVEHLYSEMKQNKLLNDKYLRQFEESTQYAQYKKLRKKRPVFENQEDYVNQIIALAELITKDELKQIVISMKQDEISDERTIQDGFIQLVINLPNEGFFDAVEFYFKQDTPFNIRPDDVTKKIIQLMGFQKAWEFIEYHDFSQKNNWLISLAKQVDDRIINSDYADKILNLVINSNKHSRFIPPSLLYRIDRRCKGFAYKFLKCLLNKDKDNALFISDLLRTDEELLSIFKYPEEPLLEEAYLSALSSGYNFDHNKRLLLLMIQKNKGFLRTVLIKILEAGDYQNSMKCLWELDNYEEIIDETIEIIKEFEDMYLPSYKMIQLLFDQNDFNVIEKQNSWLVNYINNYYSDIERMREIFKVMCKFQMERRLKFILFICRKNPSCRILDKLDIFDSANLPGDIFQNIEECLLLVDKVKRDLIGLDYLEDQVYLDSQRVLLDEEMESMLNSEFI